jgi:predicted PurR-regulated permease PerM
VSDERFKSTFYTRATIFLVGMLAFFTILYLARSILIPIVFSIIIAIVLHPVVTFFRRIGINRIVAITITLLLTFLVILAFGSLLISQASRFGDSWPVLVDKFTVLINQAIEWVSGYFDLNEVKINDWLLRIQDELIKFSSAIIGQTLVIVGGGLIILFLLPVYIFLILFYQPLLIEFIRRLFGSTGHQGKVSEIVAQIKNVIQRYLIGLVIEFIIMATLETVSLILLGIDYAVFLGIIGALLNVIPYIGGLVAVAMPMIVALATESSPVYALYILVVYYLIQLIDNNYIVPKIVASKVRINALFSIIVVLAGNALWGIPGMFLSIPLLAIVKLIFEQIEYLKPWGYLLGDSMPPADKIRHFFAKGKHK